MAYVPEEHRFAIHIFMSQRGKTQFYLRMAFSEGQWPLRYFHHLSFVEQVFLFKEGHFRSFNAAGTEVLNMLSLTLWESILLEGP